MRYYNDPSLGVVGVEPGPTSGEFTYLAGRIPQYTWIRTDCLYTTPAEAEAAEPATFSWYQPDAVAEGNALCRAIAERDELRQRVDAAETELAAHKAVLAWALQRPNRSIGNSGGLLGAFTVHANGAEFLEIDVEATGATVAELADALHLDWRKP